MVLPEGTSQLHRVVVTVKSLWQGLARKNLLDAWLSFSKEIKNGERVPVKEYGFRSP